MKNRILLSQGALFPCLPSWVWRLARDGRFDGIELFTFLRKWGFNHTEMERLATRAEECGLEVHQHQIWTLEDGQAHWYNYVMSLLGMLPKEGADIQRVLRPAFIQKHPIVAYPTQLELAKKFPHVWLQTCMIYHNGKPVISLDEFYRQVQSCRPGIVFDNQHALEMDNGEPGVSHLSSDPEKLYRDTARLWKIFGPSTKEIHLVDFDPSKGDTKGRNLRLGSGVFPLHAFAQMVIDSGWTGVITPEVQSLSCPYSYANTLQQVITVRKEVEKIFGM